MKLAALFLWLAIPLGLWAVFTFWGTPHVALTWRFHDNGARYDSLARRHYIDCTYYGLAGTFTVHADQGACPWIRFFKAEMS